MCKIGEVFEGYCNGFFGSDNYGKKMVEGVGTDWIVARDASNTLCLATFKNRKQKDLYVRSWRETVSSN
jgi:hypothetical protein